MRYLSCLLAITRITRITRITHSLTHLLACLVQSAFPIHFGKQVLAGMLDLPPDAWLHGSRKQSPEADKERVQQFIKMWQPFDWTQTLEGGEYE